MFRNSGVGRQLTSSPTTAVYGGIWKTPGVRSVMAGGPYRPYAEGGWITEPVVGLGLRTGSAYSFGEAGDEYVVPHRASRGRRGGSGGGDVHNSQDLAREIHGELIKLQKRGTPVLWNGRVR
jgi:hypothetical protein